MDQDQRKRQIAQLGVDSAQDDGEVPEIAPGEMEDTGVQFMVQPKLRRKWVEVQADSQFYYTSNFFYQEEPEGNEAQDTNVLVNTIDMAIAPDPFQVGDGQLAPRLGFRSQWYNYGNFDDAEAKATKNYNAYDFDAQTVYAEVRWQFDPSWVVGVGFDWQRLLGHEPPTTDYAQFYSEYLPRWSLERFFQLREDLLLSAGYYGNYHFTQVNGPDTDVNDRSDHMLGLALTWEALYSLYLQPFGQFQYTRYTHETDPTTGDGRNDYLYTAGINLIYVINNWASLRTYFNYNHRESDDTIIQDYTEWEGGLGGTVTLRF